MMPFIKAPLLFAATWSACHLLFYLLVLRLTAAFRVEKNITNYHLLSILGLLGSLAVAQTLGGHGFDIEDYVAVGSLHGIYTLTFVSFWSSAQGGFSLRILQALRRSPLPRADVVAAFVKMGDEKRRIRLDSLVRVGLIEARGQHFHATHKGIILARAVRFLHWLNDFRVVG
jgi:hypothetical protein